MPAVSRKKTSLWRALQWATLCLMMLAGCSSERPKAERSRSVPSKQTVGTEAARKRPEATDLSPELRFALIRARQSEATEDYRVELGGSEKRPWLPAPKLRDGRALHFRAFNP